MLGAAPPTAWPRALAEVTVAMVTWIHHQDVGGGASQSVMLVNTTTTIRRMGRRSPNLAGQNQGGRGAGG